MSSFNALMASMGGPKPGPKPQVSRSISNTTNSSITATQKPAAPIPTRKPGPQQPALASKRKAEDADNGPPPKTIKIETNSTTPSLHKSQSAPTLKPNPSNSAAPLPYRGTAKPTTGTVTVTATTPAKAVKPAAKPVVSSTASTTNGTPKPAAKKGGFSSVLEKAKAAQEAMKAQGANSSTIKHKAAEKKGVLSTKEKQRREQEERAKARMAGKPGVKPAAAASRIERSRSGTPGSGPDAAARKRAAPPDSGYKGTMRRAAPEAPAYRGTMSKGPSTQQRRDKPAGNRRPGQKRTLDSLGKREYGGYASWSDLDDDELEDGDGYDSEGSSDMEAGIDDVELEEARALRAAQREDAEQKALEEAHAREKLERRKRLGV